MKSHKVKIFVEFFLKIIRIQINKRNIIMQFAQFSDCQKQTNKFNNNFLIII